MAYHHKAACPCGACTAELSSGKPLADFAPRRCDCDFCNRQGSFYVSDPSGQLQFHARAAFRRQRQGDRLADMLFCPDCGNMLGAALETEHGLVGVLNGALLCEPAGLPEPETVSPWKLNAEEKRLRWSTIWTPAEIRDCGENGA